jgi:hypothetical protein
MATDLENLQSRRSAILAELATGQTPDGASIRRPSYNIDGQSVSWNQYRKSLYEELEKIDKLIGAVGGPVENQSETKT